ncbi:MAG TPA: MMPL family transporter [Streptosporangiaceae bacterium]|nr:MMPL family transporter [Streptosporangiaceae bacterium]
MARLVIRHRLLIGIAWLAVLAAALISVSHVSGRLSQQTSLPGQPGYVTNQQILHRYGIDGAQQPLVPVVTLPPGQDAATSRAVLARAFSEVADAQPGTRVLSYPSTGNRAFTGRDGRTTFALVYLPGYGPSDYTPAISQETAILRQALPGAAVTVTGLPALSGSSSGGGTGVLAEVLIGALGALAVLAFVFASFLAFVPLLVAAVAILTTFLLILGLTYLTSVSFYVQYLIALVGLGVAIDYSLLFITRWREERAKGHDNDTAVVIAMTHAGRAIALSGGTVAIGLVALVVLPVPFLRSIGIGGILIPLVSVLACLTLLPILLATIGPRADWPQIRHEAQASRPWTRWASGVVRHRGLAALAALAVLGALGFAATGIKIGEPQSASLARSGPAYQGLTTLQADGIPTGVITPIQVLLPDGPDTGAATARLLRVPGVYTAASPAGSLLSVLPRSETSTPAGQATIARVRAASPGAGIGGDGAQTADFVHAVYGSFPLMLTLIALFTFVLLARAFRSLLLALKAVLLNLLSVGATYGVLVLVWQDGHGSKAIWGIPATGAIADFVPLIVFAFLFGLSMDYEVFILSRMREAYDETGSTSQAVVRGLARTGRLVTSAALILILAFVALASAPGPEIKMFATGLAAGILLDAVIVRSLLLPALIALLGKRNWWLPAWAERCLFPFTRQQPPPAANGPACDSVGETRELKNS